MEFLLGNPFSTAVGQRVERATGASLPSEDWALNMEICDVINSLEEGPRDAVRAIRKRIAGNKNFKEVMLALTVLETCVKNCGYRFHVLVTTRDFIEGVLVRAIIPRNNPPLILHDRVLSIVQAWADAFRSSPDLTGVVSVYEDLRRKGLEFPMTELDGYSAPAAKKNPPGPAVTTLPASALSSKLIPPLTSELKLVLDGREALTSSQVETLKTELGVVRENLSTMSDLMARLDPVTVKRADVELLEQLYSGCKDMQERIVTMVPRLSEEKLIQELLDTNDQMNSAFSRYQRFERRLTDGQNSTEKMYVNLSDVQAGSQSEDSAFSQSKSNSLSSDMARLSTCDADDLDSLTPRPDPDLQPRQNGRGDEVDDGPPRAGDGLLHSRADFSPASSHDSSPKLDWMIKRGMIPVAQSTPMDDIEKWLTLDDDDLEDLEDSDGVTSEEFDKFLAGRAMAAERLPSVRSSQNHSDS